MKSWVWAANAFSRWALNVVVEVVDRGWVKTVSQTLGSRPEAHDVAVVVALDRCPSEPTRTTGRLSPSAGRGTS